jgi:hypothetical protein
MARGILMVLMFSTMVVLADNLVFTGKALGYQGKPAELWASFDAQEFSENAVKIGTIQANGRFTFELPENLPAEILSAPEIDLSCGQVTPDLKLGVLTTLVVKEDDLAIGEVLLADRKASLSAMLSGQLEGSGKVVLWFYANQAGFIKQSCLEGNVRQIANVTFVKGWNAVMGYVQRKGEILTTTIRNGYTEGLQRWFFVPQAPDPEQP